MSMQVQKSFSFSPSGWLDRNDTNYWEKSHAGWFKLFGYSEEHALVESVFTPDLDPFENMSTCTFYTDSNGSVELISLYLNLPYDRYEQIHATLIRHARDLGEIEVSIGIGSEGHNNEYDVSEVVFETCIGKYFHDSER